MARGGGGAAVMASSTLAECLMMPKRKERDKITIIHMRGHHIQT
jgi:hypothetical protein